MPFPLKNDEPTAKPAFPTQSPAGNAPALPIGGPPSPSITTETGPPTGAAGAADPVELVTQIQTLLDQLAEMVGGPPEEEVEMEPQSDEEIMAGLKPSPKKPPVEAASKEEEPLGKPF
jgi:hypothetical protein